MIWFIVLALVVAFLFWVSRKPDTFSLARSTTINATPQDVFPWINNLKRFNQWNPWSQMEPTSVINYQGPEEGPQASYSWSGKKTGEGSMTLVDQTPPTNVSFALNFVKPWKANNQVNFTLREANGATLITWTMSGTNAFTNKLFQTFVNMDKMVGKDFERGLANLKTLAEAKTLS
jgi:hypothetical protein